MEGLLGSVSPHCRRSVCGLFCLCDLGGIVLLGDREAGWRWLRRGAVLKIRKNRFKTRKTCNSTILRIVMHSQKAADASPCGHYFSHEDKKNSELFWFSLGLNYLCSHTTKITFNTTQLWLF